MRGLTVRQPWAWAIIHGGKDVENRSRNIAGSYRGPVAIHAGAGLSEEGCMLVPDLLDATRPDLLAEYADATLTYGAIIGVVDLVDVHDSGDCLERDMWRLARLYGEQPDEFSALPDNGAGGLIGRVRHCSPWAAPDAWHLVLANPRPLAVPIPYKGRLGLWTLLDDVLA